MAFVLSEDMRCAGCGQPKHEAWNPDSEGYYEFHDAICQGCAELHRANEGEREHRPERKVFLLDTRPKDQPLRPWDPLSLSVNQVDQHEANEQYADGQNDGACDAELPERASGCRKAGGDNSKH